MQFLQSLRFAQVAVFSILLFPFLLAAFLIIAHGAFVLACLSVATTPGLLALSLQAARPFFVEQ